MGRPAVIECVGYVRVSTEEQASGGVSLEGQTDRVRGFAAFQGLRLVDVLSDPGGSGKSLDRPGLRAALAWLEAEPGRGLVVAKLDRLSRSVLDWGRLAGRYFGPDAPCRAALFSVGDSIDTRTAAGRFYLNLLFSVAEWERETICERTRAALATIRARGERVGSVPYGYELAADGRRLLPHLGERAAAELALELAGSGRSLRQIGAALEAAGFGTRSGRPWSAARVRELVRRARELAGREGVNLGEREAQDLPGPGPG